MFKQSLTKSTKELQLTMDLLVRIRRKLHSLGYNQKEIRKMILDVVSKVLNISVESNMAFEKIILNKLKQKHKDENKISQMLIIELDIFLNSFYDNYESEDDASKVKLESITIESFDKKIEFPKFVVSKQPQKNDITSPKNAKHSFFSRDFRMNLMQEHQADNIYKKALTRRKLLQTNYYDLFLDDQRL